MKILKSKEDKSANFVMPYKSGYLESRFVQRSDDYFCIYLSSHSGCNKSCKFCHLTQTNQTQFDECDVDHFIKQANNVFKYYDDNNLNVPKVHFNWMARGEPLSNKNILYRSGNILCSLEHISSSKGLDQRYNISTIMPIEMKDHSLVKMFKQSPVYIYYSIYSIKEEFRKKWLPKALPVEISLQKLKNWYNYCNGNLKLHWAFIKDNNDSLSDLYDMINLVQEYKINPKINIVRYNPANNKSQEAEEEILYRNYDILSNYFDTKIIQRVGHDVKASCGMFVDKKEFE